MYKKAWCTCKVVVCQSRPITLLPFSLTSPSSLRSLLIHQERMREESESPIHGPLPMILAMNFFFLNLISVLCHTSKLLYTLLVARMTSCNFKPGGFLIPQPITQQSINMTCGCGITFMKVKGFRQFLNNTRNASAIYTSCKVPVWRFLMPSWSIPFGNVSEAWNNGALGLGNIIRTT